MKRPLWYRIDYSTRIKCFSTSLSHHIPETSTVEVRNKATILNEIDASIGRTKPPAFEYLYVEPAVFSNPFSTDSTGNPYGHAAVRYTDPETGKSIVMNSM